MTLVLAFHAFPAYCRGGFIGVDIFFVLSGFLISTIILENLSCQRFSFSEFYYRRIRRIFPALLVVLSFVLVVGYFYLFAFEFRSLGKHVAGGSAFSANILLLFENSYFDQDSDKKILLHLWSLGIEEQFYIFWPFFLWLFHRLKLPLLGLVLVSGLSSFIFNIVCIEKLPTLTFYLPLTRLWELLVGAYLAAKTRSQGNTSRVNFPDLASSLGAGLIVCGLILTDSDRAFPGYYALFPTVGAALLVYAGPQAWLNRKILSNRLLVVIGLISYPLYLWHWPLLAFCHIFFATPSKLLLGALIAVAFALAWLTFTFVEKPLKKSPQNILVAVLCGLMVAIFGCGAVAYTTGGLPGRAANEPFKDVDYGLFATTRNGDHSCQEQLGLNPVAEEVCLTNSRQPQVLIVGDSHAMAVFSSLYGNDAVLPAMLIAGHSCLPYKNLSYHATNKKTYGNNCTAVAQEAVRVAKLLPSISTVILVTHFQELDKPALSIYFQGQKQLADTEAFTLGYGDFVATLVNTGKNVIYMASTPMLKNLPADCALRSKFIPQLSCDTPRALMNTKREVYLQYVGSLKKAAPILVVVDPIEVFCNDQVCGQYDQNHDSLYIDDSHISVRGSQKVVELLKKNMRIESPSVSDPK